MSPLVDLSVIIALDSAVGFGRDNGGCAALVEVLQQPVRIKRLVREQRIKRNAPDQRRDTFHIMRLSRQQQKAHQITERIHQCNDFGRQSATRAPNGLSLSPPFAPVAFWWT